jgi:hypothetical protein
MKMSMAEAVRHLHLKECLKVSDRFAMFGNLGYYHHRIDKNRAVKLQLGFTACALAMALYNGDSSPLFCGVPERPLHPYVDADRLPTWLPHHPTYLEGIGSTSGPSISSKLLPKQSYKALVLDGKLAMKGFMWDISQYRKFEDVAEQMRTEQDTISKLQLLLRTLCRFGHHDLLAIIVSLWMYRPPGSPAKLADNMIAIQEWFQQMRPWPADIFWAPENISAPGSGGLAEKICAEIAAGRPLLLGSCRKEGDELTCLCLGSLDMKQVFSPLSSLSCDFIGSDWDYFNRTNRDGGHWSVESTSCRVSQRLQGKLLKHLDGDGHPGPHVFRVLETIPVIMNPFVWVPIAHQDPSFRYRLKIPGKQLFFMHRWCSSTAKKFRWRLSLVLLRRRHGNPVAQIFSAIPEYDLRMNILKTTLTRSDQKKGYQIHLIIDSCFGRVNRCFFTCAFSILKENYSPIQHLTVTCSHGDNSPTIDVS